MYSYLYNYTTELTDHKRNGIVANSVVLKKICRTSLEDEIELEEQNESAPITRTTGIPLYQKNKGQLFEEDSNILETSHKELTGKPSASTESFLKLKLKKTLGNALDHLKNFQESFEKPEAEAPMFIHLVKKTLDESWEFITEKDTIISLILPALEGALRQKKWQNYSHHQISIIQTILKECIDEKIHTRKDALKKISWLYKEDIDIFPSAPEEAYGED